MLSFEEIPPSASNCQLRISIPPGAFLWWSQSGQDGKAYLTYPTIAVYKGLVGISQSSSWSFETFANLSPLKPIAENSISGDFTTADFRQGLTEIIFAMQCPGPSSPAGGAVTYVFMIDPLPVTAGNVYASAQLALTQDYTDPANPVGVYLRYES